MDLGRRPVGKVRGYLWDLRIAWQQLKEIKKQPRKVNLTLCCIEGGDHFTHDLCDALSRDMIVRRAIYPKWYNCILPVRAADVVWLEWGDKFIKKISKRRWLLKGKKVILRLHSFEILEYQADKIDFSFITDIVFVSSFMRDLFMSRRPELAEGRRIHVINNAIKLERFPYRGHHQRGNKIAFVGRIHSSKDPMLLLQAFWFLFQEHPQFELHIAGSGHSLRLDLAMKKFITENGLESAVKFYGFVEDISSWLHDKDYIICTSPIEGQGVGLLEALHTGLRPLIFNFPGAEDLYPRDYLWNNLLELGDLLYNGPEPEACRRFVADNNALYPQLEKWRNVILSTDYCARQAEF